MIKFTFSKGRNGKTSLGIGITQGNIDRLKEGKPIAFNLQEMKAGLAITDEVMIYFGATEDDCVNQVKSLFSKDTKFATDPPPETPAKH